MYLITVTVTSRGRSLEICVQAVSVKAKETLGQFKEFLGKGLRMEWIKLAVSAPLLDFLRSSAPQGLSQGVVVQETAPKIHLRSFITPGLGLWLVQEFCPVLELVPYQQCLGD